MAIKFKVIERGHPGVPGGSEKKIYASANLSGEMTLSGLTKSIEKISTVSGADIRAVLYAMVDVMQDALVNRQIVRVGELEDYFSPQPEWMLFTNISFRCLVTPRKTIFRKKSSWIGLQGGFRG